ncbi:MAG: type II toxin-antitoxin system HicB family antitoxin [bacterium]
MLKDYLDAALRNADYEIMEDGSVYGEIPLCKGVYAKSDNFESCRNELIEVLEEWIFIRLKKGLDIPVIENINLNILELEDAAV